MISREEVIRLALEAGFADDGVPVVKVVMLERFAALAYAAGQAAEREECAKVVEDTDVEQFTYCMVLQDDGCATLANAAAAIRARD